MAWDGEIADTGAWDADAVRSTIETLVDEYRARGETDPFAATAAWTANRDSATEALERFRVGPLGELAGALAALPNQPPWFRSGAHRSFIGTLAERAPGSDAAAIVAEALTVPISAEDAAGKIWRLAALAEATDKLYPGAGFAPTAASMVWSFQDPQAWPWLSVEAESALWTLRLLPKNLPLADRYLQFRSVVLLAPGPAPETIHALAAASKSGWRSLSPALYARLAENASLRESAGDGGNYRTEEDRRRAERNILSALGEMELLAAGINDDVGAILGRAMVRWKTDPRTGGGALFFRADAYTTHGPTKGTDKPSARVWATPAGLAVGIHFGSGRGHDGYAALAGQWLASGLPDEVQFFEVRPATHVERLRPAGDELPDGDLFVGTWFPGGLTGTKASKSALETMEKLAPLFDAMVSVTGEITGRRAAPDDPLGDDVAEFLVAASYPTDADRNAEAEREQMAAAISEDGLLGFDLHEFRRIINTSRYGGPGPQANLNTSLSQMSPEALDHFAVNLGYLLRGSDPLEHRIDALMDQTDRGVKGLGESVIVKLLAIEYPTSILPVFVYRGPKGKGRLLRTLGIGSEGLEDLAIGERVVRSNELLRERLTPFFGDDMWGMTRFLYWYLDRSEQPEETPDEIDHVANLADETFVPRETLDEIICLLQEKRQIVFYGPPGTGKTYLARKLAQTLAPDALQRALVQFHPSTSYEDFFEGYRPETDAEGRLTYRLVKGPLAVMADRAREHPTKPHVMVIDEINRGHLPKVFGELLFLLEYRNESVRSLYRPDEPFELPANLLIIGTMNTADRSIALVDAAMRRRFYFVPFFPNEGPMAGLLRRWLAANDEPDRIADLLDMVNEELRERLGGPHLQIGPSHFMRQDLDEAALRRIWTYAVYPFVEEQLYGDQAAIAEYSFERVWSRFSRTTPAGELEDVSDGPPDRVE